MLIHYLYSFFQTTLTIPKIKDLVNRPASAYKEIYETINNDNHNHDYDKKYNHNISSNINSNNQNMKDELKSYLNNLSSSAPTSINNVSSFEHINFYSSY
jgi:vacuolar-type H+-ATPase catalytic subunit A/Vma1